MKEYELYIPLLYNDGTPLEQRKIERIGERLLEEFQGVTFFPQVTKASGEWAL